MITINKKAAEEIKIHLVNPENRELMIRFAVEQTEEGFDYLMGFDELQQGDINLESNGIKYLVAYEQKELLKGTIIDFDEINKEEGYQFIFSNPNDKNQSKDNE
jgi:Fe-S cluster assembly iron-binding protein IscA